MYIVSIIYRPQNTCLVQLRNLSNLPLSKFSDVRETIYQVNVFHFHVDGVSCDNVRTHHQHTRFLEHAYCAIDHTLQLFHLCDRFAKLILSCYSEDGHTDCRMDIFSQVGLEFSSENGAYPRFYYSSWICDENCENKSEFKINQQP